MASKHAADAEGIFRAYNVTPDFCMVGKHVVAFDIQQVLIHEKSDYSPNVRARGCKVLYAGSVIKGVQGNAGRGVSSSVSQDAGDSKVLAGSRNLFVNGNPAARHGDEVTMNISSADNGTLGLLQTMCKAPTPASPTGTPELKPWDGKTHKSSVEEYLEKIHHGESLERELGRGVLEAAEMEVGGMWLGKALSFLKMPFSKMLGEVAAMSKARTFPVKLEAPGTPTAPIIHIPEPINRGAHAGGRSGLYISKPTPDINKQKQAGHIKGTPQYKNRVKQSNPTSSFDNEADATKYTQEAWEKGAEVPGRPGVKDYDFGTRVGDAANGKGYNTQVRVTIDSAGKIHGFPKGPVTPH
jgi:uncharacterized Zn-binding protein involved in type VI secretion